MLIYQRQYAKHYVLARVTHHRMVVDVARPNAVAWTLDTHILPSLDGGGLCVPDAA